MIRRGYQLGFRTDSAEHISYGAEVSNPVINDSDHQEEASKAGERVLQDRLVGIGTKERPAWAGLANGLGPCANLKVNGNSSCTGPTLIPIFIGGTGRSGTSILKKVVASHPAVASIPTEMRIIVDPGGLLDLQRALTDHWSPYAADIAIQQFRALLDDAESTNILKKVTQRAAYAVGASPRRYSSLGVGDSVGRKYYRTRTEQLLDSLSNRLEGTAWMGTPGPRPTSKLYNTEYSRVATCSPLLREFVEDLFKASAGDRTATHFVEDTPYNILAAPDLMQVFPNMRLVHVYRDFRDVLASYQRQHWGKGNLLMIARRIRSIMERWRELRV
ncbi:MAG: sulfotransferase, partial [Dehalococcoidia bacterium]